MLTEQNIADKIEVVENGTVQVRTANIVLKDGVELARNFHRHTISPGEDYSAEDQKVKDICAAVHTAEVIAAYEAAQESV